MSYLVELNLNKRPCQPRSLKMDCQPQWVSTPQVPLCLSKVVSGWDWFRFTSTCRDLRKYSKWNKLLTVHCTSDKPAVFLCGVTKVIFREHDLTSFPQLRMLLPDTITSIDILSGATFDAGLLKVSSWSLPQSLVRLDVSCSDIVITGPPPWRMLTNLRALRLYQYNGPVSQLDLPDSLQILNLGRDFDQPVIGWKLPESLVTLRLGGSFNQNVVGWALPSGLKTLDMGYQFNRPVIG